MFFKKRKIGNLPGRLIELAPLSEIAWDDKTLNWIAESNRLDVRVTHISKTVSLGQTRVDEEFRNTSEWEIHGVMTHPKFIPVNITFTTDEKQFGGFSYNQTGDRDFNGRKISLPILELWLLDRDEQKAKLLYTALHDAIISGRKYIGVRFWKKKGDGLMTQTDNEYGYSYESRYVILGMVVWPELQADRLPKWAVPMDQNDFSLDALPESRFDLDGQLK